jgi:hypothetical protein
MVVPGRRSARRTLPRIEALEDRMLLSCVEISGFVYHDANHNGLLDPGETHIANNTIQLKDAAGNLITSTPTDGNGFYRFDTDPHISTDPKTVEYTAIFADKTTDWTDSKTLPQFDPAQGTLTSVEIQVMDQLTNHVQVENLDSAPATIHVLVNGNETFSGPSVPSLVTPLTQDQSFSASAFDGVMDFAGPDSRDFGPQTVRGNNSVILNTPDAIAPYIGGGVVTFTGSAHTSTSATGSANLVLLENTSASGQVKVIYHFTPSNCLPQGDYILTQPLIPVGFQNGLKTSGNVVAIPNSDTTDSIHIHLGADSLTNNNFGLVQPSSLAGYVYYDQNDNGIKEPGEPGIGGVPVNLTGIDDKGQSVNQTQTTAADGSYNFTNLRLGTYTLTEQGTPGFLDGKDTIGTPGGNTSRDQFSNIKLPDDYNGVNNNFGEIKPASLSGFVYLDNANSGVKASNSGLAGIPVTLTGIDNQGNSVNQRQLTAADGSYKFDNLRPGTYTLSEKEADGYQDGKDNVGSLGGDTSLDQFANVKLTMGAAGTDYDFGEQLAPSPVVPQPPPPPPPPPATLSPPVPGQVLGKQFFLGFHSVFG